MGFSSMDDFLTETTVNGKFYRSDWNKLTHGTTAQVAGNWHILSQTAGTPAASSLLGTGTNLTLQPGWHDVTPGAGGILHGGDVAPDTKHAVNASAFSAAVTTMPAIFLLCDVLAHVPITTVTTTGNQTITSSVTFTADNTTDIITHTGYDIPTFSRVRLTTTGTLPAGTALATDYWTIRQSATTSKLAASLANAVAGTAVDMTTNGTGTHTLTALLPRYGDGRGVQALLTPSTVMGAGAPTATMTYTNTAGTSGRTTPSSPTLPTLNTTSPVAQISYSGTGAGKYGPFIPLASGDQGIQSAQGINFSATMTSGVQNLMLVRPLFSLPMTTLGVPAERDLMNQIPSLPRIYDGACLTWLHYAGAATPINSGFYGHLDFAWGS